MFKEKISDNFYRLKIERNSSNINLQQLVSENDMKATIGFDYKNDYIVLIDKYELDRFDKLLNSGD